MIKKDIDMSLFKLLACERFLDEGINEINYTPDRKFWLITIAKDIKRGEESEGMFQLYVQQI